MEGWSVEAGLGLIRAADSARLRVRAYVRARPPDSGATHEASSGDTTTDGRIIARAPPGLVTVAVGGARRNDVDASRAVVPGGGSSERSV